MTSPRAITDDERRARADSFLDAALRLMDDDPWISVPVSRIVAETGLAKGTFFLYFPTKESLGLALVERLALGWSRDARDTLAGTAGPVSCRELGRLLSESLRGRRKLLQLLGILGSILERNVTAARIGEFKRLLRDQLGSVASEVARLAPHLDDEGALRFLIRVNAMVVGLQAAAASAPPVVEALADDALAPFRIDFHDELAELIALHLEGLEARAGGLAA